MGGDNDYLLVCSFLPFMKSHRSELLDKLNYCLASAFLFFTSEKVCEEIRVDCNGSTGTFNNNGTSRLIIKSYSSGLAQNLSY